MPTVFDVYKILSAAYGYQGWWPLVSKRGSPGFDGRGYRLYPAPHSLSIAERVEITLGAVLTQNTSWKNVEKALDNLLDAGALSAADIADIPVEELQALIRPSGYFRQKAGRLKELIPLIFGKTGNGGDCSPDRDFLLSLRGIGPETADSILLYAYNRATFIADLYTRRFHARLAGDKKIDKYESVKSIFENGLPGDAELYGEYHALIVKHGKEHCSARPVCRGCPCFSFCRGRREG
jgi:endonuclease-3 related protein